MVVKIKCFFNFLSRRNGREAFFQFLFHMVGKKVLFSLPQNVRESKEVFYFLFPKYGRENNIQIWHLGECNINFYCTLKNDIARGACAECNIIFQSAIKIDIARNQSAIFVLLYAYCSFK